MDRSKKRVLLMHISSVSGHRSASLAIEQALQGLSEGIETKNIDGFNYTNPRLEKLINALYMFVIRFVPRFWEHLYDNKSVLRKTRKIRSLMHRMGDRKIRKLFNAFRPDIVICTQAFPCGMVADYKRRHNLNTPLMGVLTDYAPHLYWLSDFVDAYIVPAPKVQQRFLERGVAAKRLKVLGIPIDAKFREQSNQEETLRRLGLNPDLPAVLVMGGGQGLGPIKEIVSVLDGLKHPAQIIVVCGTNKRLYRRLKKISFTKAVRVVGYAQDINALMDISAFIVSKPGGLTCAEALSKSLPMVIVKPLPGQESLNTRFLLEAGVALKVEKISELRSLAEEFLNNSAKLDKLRSNASGPGQADSALKIARLALEMLQQRSDNS